MVFAKQQTAGSLGCPSRSKPQRCHTPINFTSGCVLHTHARRRRHPVFRGLNSSTGQWSFGVSFYLMVKDTNEYSGVFETANGRPRYPSVIVVPQGPMFFALLLLYLFFALTPSSVGGVGERQQSVRPGGLLHVDFPGVPASEPLVHRPHHHRIPAHHVLPHLATHPQGVCVRSMFFLSSLSTSTSVPLCLSLSLSLSLYLSLCLCLSVSDGKQNKPIRYAAGTTRQVLHLQLTTIVNQNHRCGCGTSR